MSNFGIPALLKGFRISRQSPSMESAKDVQVSPPHSKESGSFRSDSRLWLARKGEFGSYKLYLGSGEKIIFHVWSYVHSESGRRHIHVFPVSYYKEDMLVMRISRGVNGKQPFLSGGILFGKFDIERIPGAHRDKLESWALLIIQGVRMYDEKIAQKKLK